MENNAELRKNYNCKEEGDYFNRAGHACYDDSSYMVYTILIGIVVIVAIYLLGYRLPKKIKQIRKKKLEEKAKLEEEGIDEKDKKK